MDNTYTSDEELIKLSQSRTSSINSTISCTADITEKHKYR